MTHFGKIKSYDAGKGTGTITPDKGGDALTFKKSDLQQEASEPKQGQRFGYETNQADGGDMCATNLRQQEQGENVKRDQASKQQG